MWDLWCTKWHWDRFFPPSPEYFGFPLSISFHRCSITRERTKNNHHHLHHRVVQEAFKLRCARSVCCGVLLQLDVWSIGIIMVTGKTLSKRRETYPRASVFATTHTDWLRIKPGRPRWDWWLVSNELGNDTKESSLTNRKYYQGNCPERQKNHKRLSMSGQDILLNDKQVMRQSLRCFEIKSWYF
jgi:hypothetical protein